MLGLISLDRSMKNYISDWRLRLTVEISAQKNFKKQQKQFFRTYFVWCQLTFLLFFFGGGHFYQTRPTFFGFCSNKSPVDLCKLLVFFLSPLNWYWPWNHSSLQPCNKQQRIILISWLTFHCHSNCIRLGKQLSFQWLYLVQE